MAARFYAAKRALRAHFEARNTRRHHIDGAAFFTMAGNPDLKDDISDTIADLIHLALSLDLDAASVLRCAIGNAEAEAGRTIDAPPIPRGLDLSEAATLAQTLANGATADIWYDAAAYGDAEGHAATIDATQKAMEAAAVILRAVGGKA